MTATNVIFERYTFNQRTQAKGETFDSFLTSLRQLSSSCEYGVLQDDLIRDRIVCGIHDENVRKRLLQEANLTLAKCVTTCKAAEVSEHQLSHFKQESVHHIRQPPRLKNCKYCGGGHRFGKAYCPASGHTCQKCGRENHFEQIVNPQMRKHHMEDPCNDKIVLLTAQAEMAHSSAPPIEEQSRQDINNGKCIKWKKTEMKMTTQTKKSCLLNRQDTAKR